MADEDHPLSLAVEQHIDPPEPMSAAELLRAFEDEHFGTDAVRINGRIERGSGSRFQLAKPEVRTRYEAIEKLVGAEDKLNSARAALAVAESEHRTARSIVEAADASA